MWLRLVSWGMEFTLSRLVERFSDDRFVGSFVWGGLNRVVCGFGGPEIGAFRDGFFGFFGGGQIGI